MRTPVTTIDRAEIPVFADLALLLSVLSRGPVPAGAPGWYCQSAPRKKADPKAGPSLGRKRPMKGMRPEGHASHMQHDGRF